MWKYIPLFLQLTLLALQIAWIYIPQSGFPAGVQTNKYLFTTLTIGLLLSFIIFLFCLYNHYFLGGFIFLVPIVIGILAAFIRYPTQDVKTKLFAVFNYAAYSIYEMI